MEGLSNSRLVPAEVQPRLHPTASPPSAVLPVRARPCSPLLRHHPAITCQQVRTFPKGSYGKQDLWRIPQSRGSAWEGRLTQHTKPGRVLSAQHAQKGESTSVFHVAGGRGFAGGQKEDPLFRSQSKGAEGARPPAGIEPVLVTPPAI